MQNELLLNLYNNVILMFFNEVSAIHVHTCELAITRIRTFIRTRLKENMIHKTRLLSSITPGFISDVHVLIVGATIGGQGQNGHVDYAAHSKLRHTVCSDTFLS